MNDCIFCKIIAGEIPATKVYEDSEFLAFLDLYPVNIGHTLIVPKKHFENIHDLPDDILIKMSLVVKKVSGAVKDGVNADGINVTSNNGTHAGQVIFHSHTHIIPRFAGDGFPMWRGARGYNEGEMEMTAEKISEKLK